MSTTCQLLQIAPKVIRQLTRALQPALTNVRVDWKPLEGKGDNSDGKVFAANCPNFRNLNYVFFLLSCRAKVVRLFKALSNPLPSSLARVISSRRSIYQPSTNCPKRKQFPRFRISYLVHIFHFSL